MIVDANTYPIHEIQQATNSQYIYQTQQQVIYPRHYTNLAESSRQNSTESDTDSDSYLNGFKLNLDKFISNLKNITARSSSARCARSIRIALQSAGAKFSSHPVAAADWGDTLIEIGYKEITPSFDEPQEGDIYIIDRTKKHRYGHIAGYSGHAWVSDYKQASYDVYRNSNVTYKYYRL